MKNLQQHFPGSQLAYIPKSTAWWEVEGEVQRTAVLALVDKLCGDDDDGDDEELQSQ